MEAPLGSQNEINYLQESSKQQHREMSRLNAEKLRLSMAMCRLDTNMSHVKDMIMYEEESLAECSPVTSRSHVVYESSPLDTAHVWDDELPSFSDTPGNYDLPSFSDTPGNYDLPSFSDTPEEQIISDSVLSPQSPIRSPSIPNQLRASRSPSPRSPIRVKTPQDHILNWSISPRYNYIDPPINPFNWVPPPRTPVEFPRSRFGYTDPRKIRRYRRPTPPENMRDPAASLVSNRVPGMRQQVRYVRLARREPGAVGTSGMMPVTPSKARAYPFSPKSVLPRRRFAHRNLFGTEKPSATEEPQTETSRHDETMDWQLVSI